MRANFSITRKWCCCCSLSPKTACSPQSSATFAHTHTHRWTSQNGQNVVLDARLSPMKKSASSWSSRVNISSNPSNQICLRLLAHTYTSKAKATRKSRRQHDTSLKAQVGIMFHTLNICVLALEPVSVGRHQMALRLRASTPSSDFSRGVGGRLACSSISSGERPAADTPTQ